MARKTNRDNNTAYVIWGVIILIVVFFLSFFLFRNLGTIEHEGLTFTKERVGELTVYHYYYLYADRTGQLVQNNIYLRLNPKKNDIPREGGEITYLPRRFTYVSINTTALQQCNQSAVALSELSSFLANGGLQVRGAILENRTDLGNATRYVTCETDPYNTVIQVNSGEESKIVADKLCYDIQFSSCDDVLPVVEEFIVQSIIDAKEASERQNPSGISASN